MTAPEPIGPRHIKLDVCSLIVLSHDIGKTNGTTDAFSPVVRNTWDWPEEARMREAARIVFAADAHMLGPDWLDDRIASLADGVPTLRERLRHLIQDQPNAGENR